MINTCNGVTKMQIQITILHWKALRLLIALLFTNIRCV